MILYTFSKKFAMTGWRLGCAAAPVPVAEQIAKLNTNDESCTTHFVQAAGVEALHDPSGSAPILAELERRRDAAIDALARVPGVHCAKPEATFYLFPNVTEAVARTGLRDRHRLRHRGAAQHGRLVLHSPPLRQRPAGRDRALHPARVLRHLGRRHHRGHRPARRMGGARRMTARIAVLGRIPASGLEVLHQVGEVWAWDHDDHIPDDVRNAQLATAHCGGDAADEQGRRGLPRCRSQPAHRRQRRGRVQQHRRRRLRAAGRRRDQHAGRARRRHRRPGDGVDPDGDAPDGRGRAADPVRRAVGVGHVHDARHRHPGPPARHHRDGRDRRGAGGAGAGVRDAGRVPQPPSGRARGRGPSRRRSDSSSTSCWPRATSCRSTARTTPTRTT